MDQDRRLLSFRYKELYEIEYPFGDPFIFERMKDEEITAYDFIKGFLKIREPSVLEILEKNAEIRQFKKGDYLISSGNIPARVPILIKGCIRYCYNTQTGEERTECIAYEMGDFIVSFNSINDKVYSDGIFLEDSLVLLIPINALADAFKMSEQVKHIAAYISSKWLKIQT